MQRWLPHKTAHFLSILSAKARAKPAQTLTGKRMSRCIRSGGHTCRKGTGYGAIASSNSTISRNRNRGWHSWTLLTLSICLSLRASSDKPTRFYLRVRTEPRQTSIPSAKETLSREILTVSSFQRSLCRSRTVRCGRRKNSKWSSQGLSNPTSISKSDSICADLMIHQYCGNSIAVAVISEIAVQSKAVHNL